MTRSPRCCTRLQPVLADHQRTRFPRRADAGRRYRGCRGLDLLFAAFGVGVWRAATHSNQALRVTGALLVAWAATGPMWFPFPMTARGDIAASTSSVADVMHGVLGAVTYLLIAATIVAGAAALGRKFRIYSVVTLLIVFGFAVPYAPSVSRIAEGEPTPWLGVFERVSFFTWLVWVGVLALALIRRTRAARR